MPSCSWYSSSRYVLSSFRSAVAELSVFVGYGAASLDGWCPTFRDSVADI
jgi:hypothetical protein